VREAKFVVPKLFMQEAMEILPSGLRGR
jgi:hypothetical protein